MTTAFEIRPAFSLKHPSDAETLASHIMGLASDETSGVLVQRAGNHIVLSPVPDVRHLWSPWLHLEIEPQETGSLLRAKYSPHPNLWTSFAFGYLTLGTLVFFAAFFAVAQSLIGQGTWGWWVTGAALAGLLVMWLVAKLGQRLAQDQMLELRHTLESILGATEDAHTGDATP